MRRFVLAAVLLGSSCTRQSSAPEGSPAPPPNEAGSPEGHWSSASKSGAAQLEQTRASDSCRARCSTSQGNVWSDAPCIGARGDFVFLTDDCSAAILIVAEPEATQPWETTPVIFVYAGAKLARSYKAGPMLKATAVERREGRFHWLSGEPRYLRNGAGVELRVLDGKTTRLPFREGAAINEETLVSDRPETAAPPARSGARPPPPPAEYAETVSDTFHAQRQASPQPHVPGPNEPRLVRMCGAGGCSDVWMQAPPTIKAAPGDPLVCRNEGEACGSNADCCGGNCSGGSCH